VSFSLADNADYARHIWLMIGKFNRN